MMQTSSDSNHDGASERLLLVRDLVTGYTAPVVGPISFRLDAGEVLGLAGPNGGGKTTLLRAIANGARIFGGTVTRRAGIVTGFMEQQAASLPEIPFTGWEYLRYTDATGDRAPPHLRRWLHQRVDSLSGGQFQLLRLWSALNGPADVVLIDEPTNNLDAESARIAEQALRTDGRGRGVIVVSHDRAFLERVADRVLTVSG